MQRYRNDRRRSTAAKQQKLKGVRLPVGTVRPVPASSEDDFEDYKESVEALQKLFEGKAAAPAQTVQSLLDATRPHRNKWLQTTISIKTILKTYPVLKIPRWGSNILYTSVTNGTNQECRFLIVTLFYCIAI